MGFWDSLSKGINDFVESLNSNGSVNNVSFTDLSQRRQFNELYQANQPLVATQADILAYSKRVAETVAVNTPDTTVGQIYTELCRFEEYSKKEKPHISCLNFCLMDKSMCEECMARRIKAMNAITLIENPQEYRNQFVVGNGTGGAAIKCSLCGAPVPAGSTVCEYCGTTVEFGGGNKIHVESEADIPNVVMAAYELVQAEVDRLSDYLSGCGIVDVLTKMYECFMVDIEGNGQYIANYRQNMYAAYQLKKKPMTYSQINSTAQKYGLDISSYLIAYLTQEPDIYNATEYAANEQAIKLNEEAKQRRAEQNRRLEEIKQRAMQSKKEIDAIVTQSRQRSMSNYGYNGGGGGSSRKCCGTCANYIDSINKCSYESELSFTRNANDFCGKYTSR